MKSLTWIAALFLSGALAPTTPSQVAAKSVLQQIHSTSAKSVLRSYRASSAKWHTVLKGIESGDPTWLAVADTLRPASDGSYTEDLDFSVASALPVSAENVLKLSNFPLANVCDVPFLEPSAKTVREFQTKGQAALAAVKDPALQSKKEQCRKILMSN